MISGLLVGVLLGVVLHRGDFCMHSAARELVTGQAGRSARAWLVALGVQMAVVNGLVVLGWLAVWPVPVAPLAAIGGGLVFGLGMIVGKG